eukprot:99919-Hanusia_phi.AAC.4
MEAKRIIMVTWQSESRASEDFKLRHNRQRSSAVCLRSVTNAGKEQGGRAGNDNKRPTTAWRRPNVLLLPRTGPAGALNFTHDAC